MASEIVIIGAGASGLMAAACLARKGYRVTVVEARDRIGGRVYTLENFFSLPAEAGAEFIHGRQPLTMSLMEESRINMRQLSGNWYELENGRVQKADFFDSDWQRVLQALDKLDADTDMNSFMNHHFGGDEHKQLYGKVKGFVEGYDAADMDRVSARALKEEWVATDDARQFRVDGGYLTVVRHLEEIVKTGGGVIVLSSPVTEVRWTRGKAEVFTETGERFEAEKVIITAPLGVLQNDSIQFHPSLPSYLAAARSLGNGGVIKFLFEFQQRFWEEAVKSPFKDAAFIFSDAWIPTWWTQSPDKTPLLTGWIGGPDTFETHDNEDGLIEKAINSLEYVFNCSKREITALIVRSYIADWVRDPFALGAYTYPTVGSAAGRFTLSHPVEDTLYFAGEALYVGPAMGTVEAALVSGRDVAGKIMSVIKTSSGEKPRRLYRN